MGTAIGLAGAGFAVGFQSHTCVPAWSAFVPVDSTPGWPQAFATHQPVTAFVSAARALSLGGASAAHVVTAVARITGHLVGFVAPATARVRTSDP